MNNKSHVSFFVSLLKEAFHNGLKMGGNGALTIGIKSERLTYFFSHFAGDVHPKKILKLYHVCTLIYDLLLNHINVTSKFLNLHFSFLISRIFCYIEKK